jgi:hypothetical protein
MALAGPIYAPKPPELYRIMEVSFYHPRRPNILSSADDKYWKAVRQAAAPCFSVTNMKLVRRRCICFLVQFTRRHTAHA